MANIYTDEYANNVNSGVASRDSAALWGGNLKYVRSQINFATTNMTDGNEDRLYIAQLPKGCVVHDIWVSTNADLSSDTWDIGLIGRGSSTTDVDAAFATAFATNDGTSGANRLSVGNSAQVAAFTTDGQGFGDALDEHYDLVAEIASSAGDITSGIIRFEVLYSTWD